MVNISKRQVSNSSGLPVTAYLVTVGYLASLLSPGFLFLSSRLIA